MLRSMTGEVQQLCAVLDGLRAGVLKKLAGLSEADARRSTVDSGTNLAGLIQHLTFVESLWFEEIVAGRKATRGKRSMQVDPTVSLKDLRADYRAACETSNEIVASIGDADAPVTRNGKTHDLRWAILAVIGETSRHAGHADIIREQIDGTTGR
ncbi:DinB family protein [Kribbella capetownensis]|uniref:DinB family protein n=2 Tax=Kribbella capetownensis TaxID=1572659 RepID=A0A4R0JEZ7_9ACTN|nr:DinB family protein [Kribbella capetownensis]